MYNKLQILIFLPIILAQVALAQQPEWEKFLEQQEEYSDVSDLIEMLADLEQNPIDLNKATIEQLATLPWISPITATAIINYRNQIGKFETIDQLAQIELLTSETITLIRKYLTVSPRKNKADFSIRWKTRLNRKLESCIGLKDGTYYPSPNKIYHRLEVNYRNHFRMGTLLEKDSGEKHIDDLKLYYLSYRNRQNENQLIIGNYRLELGHGLIFGNPSSYHKGSDPIYASRRKGRELLEYTLVDENASLYGITGKFCLKIYQFILFISSSKLDATLNLDGTVKSFYTAGYHRNASETEKKDRLAEKLVGAHICAKPAANFSLGITYCRSAFDRYGALKSDYDDRLALNRRIGSLAGGNYNLTLGSFCLFGEAAISNNQALGLLSGVLFNHPPIETVLLLRSYDRNFISLHGNSFGEHSYPPKNEQGIYWGLTYNCLRNLKCALYFDSYRFPWATFFIPMPVLGRDLWLKVEYQPIKKLMFYIQFHSSQKETNLAESDIIAPRHQESVRLQIEYRPWAETQIRHRIEKKWITYRGFYQLPTPYPHYFEGLLLYQDLNLSLRKNFDLSARITFFDTDDYESRVYQFENDVPGTLTNQMLHGLGTRWYLRLLWRIKSTLFLALKLGSTQYHHTKVMGSNEDQIIGNTLNTINFQVEWNW